jgi:hypothetical protein
MKSSWVQRREYPKSCRAIHADHVQIWCSVDNVFGQYFTEYVSEWSALKVKDRLKAEVEVGFALKDDDG